jgi:hypothetical protein
VSGTSPAAIPYIMLASVVVACVAAGAAWVSAFFSRRSSQVAANAAQIAANAAQATLYLNFQKQYASDEMLQDLRRLKSWKDQHGEDFASKWEEQWESDDDEAKAKAQALDGSRRRVSHFFGAIADLYKHGLLSEPLARLLASFPGDLLFIVLEPLEKQLNENYSKSQFDTLSSLSGYFGPRPASGIPD